MNRIRFIANRTRFKTRQQTRTQPLYDALDHTIHRAITTARFLKAARIYSRLVDFGFLPSQSLRSKFDLLRFLAQRPDTAHLLHFLPPLFAAIPGDERAFRDLFTIIARTFPFAPSLVQVTLDTFAKASGPNFTISQPTRNYVTSCVPPALQLYPQPPHSSIDNPLSKYILDRTSLRAFTYLRRGRGDPDVTYRILELLRDHDPFEPPLVISHLLIYSQLHSLRFDRAFHLYHMLKSTSSPSFALEASCFQSLFVALRKLYPRRSVHTRKIALSPKVLSPRALLQDMIQVHVQRSQSPQHVLPAALSPQVLREAVLTFLHRRDYSAALSAVCHFQQHRVPLSIETYRTVLDHIVGRIRVEVAQLRVVPLWSSHFFGSSTDIPEPNSLEFLTAVLHAGAVTKRKKPHAFKTPSVTDILQAEDTPDVRWDSAPLRRILKRAMLASDATATPDDLPSHTTTL